MELELVELEVLELVELEVLELVELEVLEGGGGPGGAGGAGAGAGGGGAAAGGGAGGTGAAAGGGGPAAGGGLNLNAKPFTPSGGGTSSTLNPNAKPFTPSGGGTSSTLNPNAKPLGDGKFSTLNPNAPPFVPASKPATIFRVKNGVAQQVSTVLETSEEWQPRIRATATVDEGQGHNAANDNEGRFKKYGGMSKSTVMLALRLVSAFGEIKEIPWEMGLLLALMSMSLFCMALRLNLQFKMVQITMKRGNIFSSVCALTLPFRF